MATINISNGQEYMQEAATGLNFRVSDGYTHKIAGIPYDEQFLGMKYLYSAINFEPGATMTAYGTATDLQELLEDFSELGFNNAEKFEGLTMVAINFK